MLPPSNGFIATNSDPIVFTESLQSLPPVIVESCLFVLPILPISPPENSLSPSLAIKRLLVGRELGLTVNNREDRAISLLEKSICADNLALANLKVRIKEVIVEDQIEEADSDQQNPRDVENGTPVAFQEEGIPIDLWKDSELRNLFLSEFSTSLSIPPGFEHLHDPNSQSIRQLRKKLKERFSELTSQSVAFANLLGRGQGGSFDVT